MKLKTDTFNNKSLYWFVVTILLIVADRITKYYISTTMDIGEKIRVIDNFFYITHHTNKGAAWGMFHNANMTLVLGILSVIVSIAMIFVFFRFDKWAIHLSLAMIISGALGNAYGRILHGEVTDFLDFYIFGYDFPIFNVADMMVTLGTGVLIVYILFFYKEPVNEVIPEITEGNESEQDTIWDKNNEQ
ncbi:MAG: signal peptidase II [Clostridiales bacterium]|nr:signal peptidase II [Clostridiales bacterium]